MVVVRRPHHHGIELLVMLVEHPAVVRVALGLAEGDNHADFLWRSVPRVISL